MAVPVFLRRVLPLFGLVLGVCASAFADDAPRPGAAGDSGHLWLVAPAPRAADGCRILHHDPRQGPELSPLPHGMAEPLALPGGAPAICSRGGVFYAASASPDGAVQLAQWRLGDPSDDGRVYLVQRNLCALPKGARLLAMAAGHRHLWLAVDGVPADILKPAETAAAAASPEALSLALRLPPGVLPGVAPGIVPAPGAGAAPPAPLAKDRRLMLLRVDGAEVHAIYSALAPADRAWLASDGDRLFFAPGAKALWRVEPKGEVPLGDPSPFTHLFAAGGAPLLAQVAAEHALEGPAWRDAVRAKWSAWDANAKPPRVEAGACALPLEAGDGFGVVEWEGRPALVRVAATFAPSKPVAVVAPVDLHGARLPAVELSQARDAEEARLGVLVLQTVVTGIAIGLMVWSWRRGPRLFPKLPQGLRRAGLPRRLAAAALDLALAAWPVALASGTSMGALLHEWPVVGDPTCLEDMRPGFVAGGLFIVHTALGEAFFGRSLGKAAFGLRVVGLDGGPAAPWRIVVRGLLKWLELLSPALFALAVFSPFGQRLGDLAAGTVVVQRRDPRE